MVEAPRPVRRALSERVVSSRRVFLGVMAIVFAASVAGTIASSASMSAMGSMEMPGGWTMSMMWMRMPGQTWLGAAASFVGMWLVMKVAMMLPSLAPLLWRHREAVARAGGVHLAWQTAVVGVGYFAVWAAFGAIVFPLGVALAAVVMREPAVGRAVPLVVGAVVLAAAILQHTGWKARHLAYCREALGCCLTLTPDASAALRQGLRLGVHCAHSCAGLTAIVLALGVMDLRVMAVAAAAITSEHLAPAGVQVARAIGAVGVVAGLLLMARAVVYR